MELITSSEKENKKERRKEVNSISKEFYKELQGKFEGCLAISTLKKSFSLGELTKLNEMDINFEEVKKMKHQYDKIIFFKLKLIPINDILKIAREIIEKDGFCLIKNLDEELQKIYIVNSRNKIVYFKFLLDIFRNEIPNSSDIKYMNRKQIGKKRVTNLLVIK
jgi:hypothetical protein